MRQGPVFEIQRFSTDDGGGIRTCVFLKGCPLRCRWCHNAEGLSPRPELAFYKENCIGCGACTNACPNVALSSEGGRVKLDRTRCVACGRCAAGCPTGALTLIGQAMTVDEVMEVVRRDKIFYGTTGGLTITGGEPLAQGTFTLALARAAKAEGISVAVETSGFGDTEVICQLVPTCDVFLFDCKADSASHKTHTGVDDALILKNLDAICQRGARVVLRCPVVADVNFNEAFVQKIIALAMRYAAIEAVQLMPYHATGREKPVALGGAAQPTFAAPDAPTLEALVARITRERGKKAFY